MLIQTEPEQACTIQITRREILFHRHHASTRKKKELADVALCSLKLSTGCEAPSKAYLIEPFLFDSGFVA